MIPGVCWIGLQKGDFRVVVERAAVRDFGVRCVVP